MSEFNNKMDAYVPSDGRRMLWKYELAMLKDIHSVCKKNKINYFMIGGGAIGAVRHKGFIPWDDDVDLGMLREDFEAFVSIMKREFADKYVIQYGYDDEGASETGTFLRIRSREAAAVIRSQLGKKRCTHGVFVEIYPFDSVPDSKIVRNIYYKISTVLKGILDHRFDAVALPGKLKVFELLTRGMSNERLWSIWEKVCRHFNGKGYQYVDTIALPQYAKIGYQRYKRAWVEKTVAVPFENIEACIPTENDSCLKMTYGDYMKLPPESERGTIHNTIVLFDPYHRPEYYNDNDIPNRYFEGETELSPV